MTATLIAREKNRVSLRLAFTAEELREACGSCLLYTSTGILFCLQFTGTAAEGNIMTIGDIPVGMIMIWVAVAIGGFTSSVSQSTFSAFWQSNTPREDIPSGQALYSFGSTGGSCIFGAVVGVVLEMCIRDSNRGWKYYPTKILYTN